MSFIIWITGINMKAIQIITVWRYCDDKLLLLAASVTLINGTWSPISELEFYHIDHSH